MRARWVVLTVVVLLAMGAAAAATAVVAHRRHLTVDDLAHFRHHHGPGTYPDSVRDAYAANCKATSYGDAALCGCVYNKMAERYTLAEFKKIEAVIELGFPDEVKQMVADCGGGTGAAAGSIGVQPAKVVDCVDAVARPDEITLACGDGGIVVRRLAWTQWGGPMATATGVLTQNDCQPDCVHGAEHDYPMTLTLSALQDGSSGMVYTRGLVQYTGSSPDGSQQSAFDLPAEPGP